MTNWNDEFQSYPCDYDAYSALKANKMPDGKNIHAYTVVVTPLKKNGRGLAATSSVLRAITNLWVKSDGDLQLPNYTHVKFDVDTLIDLNITDEIDPTMLTNPIPTASFSFRTERLNEKSTLDEVNAFLASFKDNVIAVVDSFEYFPYGIARNQNGTAAVSFSSIYDNVEKLYNDRHILGYYIVDKVDFDYETATISVDMFSYLFKRMSDEVFFEIASAMYPSCEFYDKGEAKSSSPWHTFRLAFNQFKSISNYDIQNPYLSYDDRIVASLGENPLFSALERASGLNTAHFSLLMHTSPSTYKIELPLYHWRDPTSSKINNWSNPSYEYTTDTTLIPMIYYLNDENIYDILKVTCLQNNMWMLPQNPKNTLIDGHAKNGTWHLIAGKKPNENPFFDGTQTAILDTGTYYPFKKNTPYRIYPSMLKEKSRTKLDLDLEQIKYTKTYDIPINLNYIVTTDGQATSSDPQNVELTTVSCTEYPSSISPPSDLDVNGYPAVISVPQGNVENRICRYPSAELIPLEEGYWYSATVNNVDTFIMGNDNDLAVFGFTGYKSSGSYIYAFSSMITGRRINNARALYNPNCIYWRLNSTLSFYEKRPFSISVRKVSPVSTYLNIDDKPTTALGSTAKSVDSLHNATFAKGLSARVLKRANLTDLSPLYRLSWSMVNDPSLRVGTLVYVPLQNQYVKVMITKQTRTFDGTENLYCEGYVTEETTENVFDPTLLDCKATYSVVDPDHAPKGEWLEFTWSQHPSWDGIVQNVYYEFGYQPNSGSYQKIGEITLGNTEPNQYLINVPDAESKLGFKLDKTGTNGVYHIKVTYAAWGLKSYYTCAFVAVPWDNKKFSEVYVGEVEAQDTILPLMNNHWLRG